MGNSKYKILTVVGARPQFIKAAAISRTVKDKYADSICEDILHTGQHYDDNMSGRFFAELNLAIPSEWGRVLMADKQHVCLKVSRRS